MPKVSIIIVTHNSEEIIKDCLNSVYSQEFKDFEVIVVDNNSEDRTKEFIKENFPQIKLIENKKNLGFCKANNQGIEISQGKYVLTLNSDVILEKKFLSELMKEVENSPSEIGMFSPKILKMDKKTIDSTGIILTRIRRFYNRGDGEIDFGQYDDKKNIFGPSAACALYKREMLEKIKTVNIGEPFLNADLRKSNADKHRFNVDNICDHLRANLRESALKDIFPAGTKIDINIRGNSKEIRGEYFDNDFFFLVEDVDLSWRANLRGFKGYFIPQARCYHLGNSSKMGKKMRQYLSFRNRYFMLIKNEKLKDFMKNLGYFLIYDILRFFYLMFTNRFILKAIFEITYHFSRIFRKRNFCLTATYR